MDNDRPAKRAKIILDDSDSEQGNGSQIAIADSTRNGTAASAFKINQEYAIRFEHNKKREEKHRLEEKYGSESRSHKREASSELDENGVGGSEDSSSDSEDEDDDGLLATEALDSEISATLQAIRTKDPRVYDEKVTFYTDFKDDYEGHTTGEKRQKPMFLKDYHRENLLNNNGYEAEHMPSTYAQEQGDLRSTIVQEMRAATSGRESGSFLQVEESSDDDGDFLIPKNTPTNKEVLDGTLGEDKNKSRVDVNLAEKDPETFLSNFMSARAWVPTPHSRFQPFESDDEEEEKKAEAFETAYNLRFEDPKGANEKLMSHARDAAAKYSVRREEPNSRKKVRESQRQKKEAEKQEREEERARLKRLRVEEVEQKVQKIKEAAGLRGKLIKEEDWARFLEDGWDVNKWEEEMSKTFGESYYAENELLEDDDQGEVTSRNKSKVKKPRWDDEIRIDDLVPDFKDDDGKPPFTLSDVEEAADTFDGAAEVTDDDAIQDADARSVSRKGKTKKDRMQERTERKKEARKERRRIETFVDDKWDLDKALPSSSSRHGGHFRYRDTSPLSYGLTARDILEAEDKQLNQYVGLKKMAAFRDPEKKRKDKKKLGKKARLREWRKETFGHEDGPRVKPMDNAVYHLPKKEAIHVSNGESGFDIKEGKKKKKRSRKGKGQSISELSVTV